MQRFTLIRDYKPEATLGRVIDESGKEICQMLERPRIFEGKENLSDNVDTKINESCCIPEGEYLVDRNYSFKFKKMMWQITGVNGREGIRIHCANYVHQLLGCIATATKIIDMGVDQKPENRYFAKDSQLAMQRFSKVANDKFKLKITSNQSLCSVK